jgi:hypothetical protein
MNLRTFFLPLVFTCMLELSCKKDSVNNQPKPAAPTLLTGSWELRRNEFSDIAGVPQDYPPGNGNKLIFYDTTFKLFFVGYGTETGLNYTDSGTYYVKDLPNSNPQLVYNVDSLPPRNLFLINKDSLTLFVGEVAADGDILVYVKID